MSDRTPKVLVIATDPTTLKRLQEFAVEVIGTGGSVSGISVLTVTSIGTIELRSLQASLDQVTHVVWGGIGTEKYCENLVGVLSYQRDSSEMRELVRIFVEEEKQFVVSAVDPLHQELLFLTPDLNLNWQSELRGFLDPMKYEGIPQKIERDIPDGCREVVILLRDVSPEAQDDLVELLVKEGYPRDRVVCRWETWKGVYLTHPHDEDPWDREEVLLLDSLLRKIPVVVQTDFVDPLLEGSTS